MNCAHCKSGIRTDDQPDVIRGDCFYACPHCGHELFDGRTLHEWRYHEQLRRGLRSGDVMTIRTGSRLTAVKITGERGARFPAVQIDNGIVWDVSRFVYDLDAMKAHVARVNGL